MNEEQESLYVAFAANFVDQLWRSGMSKSDAETIGGIACATLLGAVLRIPAGNDEVDNFAVMTLKAAIKHIYQKRQRATLQA